MRHLTLILTLLLAGCAASTHYPPSTFTVDGRKYNSLITDRTIKHERGEVVGCIVQGQMDILLNTTNPDTIVGLLLDSKTKGEILFATVHVYQEGETDPLEIITKLDGKFKFGRQPTPERILVKYVGFHTLDVKLEDLKKKLTTHNTSN